MCLLSTGRPGQALLSFYERSYKNLHAGVWGSEPGSRAQGYGYPPPAVHPGQVPGPRNAKRCLAGGVRNHTLQVPPEQRPTCRSHGLLRGSKSGTRQALRGIPGIQERRDLMGNWAVWTRRVILDGRAGRCRPAWPVLAHAQDQTLVPQEAPVAEPSRTTENRAHPGAPPPRDQVCSERRPLGPSGWAGRPLPAPSDRDALLLPTASLAPPPCPGQVGTDVLGQWRLRHPFRACSWEVLLGEVSSRKSRVLDRTRWTAQGGVLKPTMGHSHRTAFRGVA